MKAQEHIRPMFAENIVIYLENSQTVYVFVIFYV